MCRDRHPEIFWKGRPDLAKSGVWEGGNFRIFRIFPKWKTATLVGQGLAWEVQKRYFRPKNLGFWVIFCHFPLFGGFPGSPIGLYWALLAHVGPAAVAKPLDKVGDRGTYFGRLLHVGWQVRARGWRVHG